MHQGLILGKCCCLEQSIAALQIFCNLSYFLFPLNTSIQASLREAISFWLIFVIFSSFERINSPPLSMGQIAHEINLNGFDTF